MLASRRVLILLELWLFKRTKTPEKLLISMTELSKARGTVQLTGAIECLLHRLRIMMEARPCTVGRNLTMACTTTTEERTTKESLTWISRCTSDHSYSNTLLQMMKIKKIFKGSLRSKWNNHRLTTHMQLLLRNMLNKLQISRATILLIQKTWAA